MTVNTFSQLRPFTIGYDDIFDHFERLMEHRVPNYPPYNIIKTGEYTHDIEVALAGYTKDDIEVEVKENTLTIKSVSKESFDDDTMVHKGIAKRAFTRVFSLAEDVVVQDAELKDGLLKVSLERIIPEEKKPRLIEIK
tara:strand:+ start:806 stop:1219 length:414 start_codon:yes stop_codon:yes gene_type:complete